MSRHRPSHRDRLEGQYLAEAQRRSAVAEELRVCDLRLLAMQREMDRVEAPRREVGEPGGRPRVDALEMLPESKLSVLPDLDAMDHGQEEENEVAESSDEADWKLRALRMTALVVGVCRMIVRSEEKQPKLVAFSALHALGVDCDSMREVAKAYALTPARISQRAEDMRVKFNLPKNQHNKSEAAVESYRATAYLNRGAA